VKLDGASGAVSGQQLTVSLWWTSGSTQTQTRETMTTDERKRREPNENNGAHKRCDASWALIGRGFSWDSLGSTALDG
jgi:hypothetical protein